MIDHDTNPRPNWEMEIEHVLNDDGTINYGHLTEMQLEELEQGPGFVREPSPQMQFADVEEFERRQNNFNMYFKEGTYCDHHRAAAPAYARFAIMFPAFTARLMQRAKEYPERWTPMTNPGHIEELFLAYKIMSQLVNMQEDMDSRQDDSGHHRPIPEYGSKYLCA